MGDGCKALGEGPEVGEKLVELGVGWWARSKYNCILGGGDFVLGEDVRMVGGDEFGLEDSALQGEYKEEKGSNCPGKGK